jgi:ectoine hydroxylase-related dioxygenase (phytanoyl-CoA dioxygenase family)
MFEYAVKINEFNSGIFTVGCETGKLLLFPSWLEHSTDQNKTENRITLSFNTTYLPKKN